MKNLGGFEALAEAARLERARIAAWTVREHHNVVVAGTPVDTAEAVERRRAVLLSISEAADPTAVVA